MEAELKNDFSKGKLSSVIMRLAAPMIAAQFINLLYNVVDRMYIGRIAGTGSLALTGVGVCMPIVYIITAFANLCGTGGTPLFSMARGRGDVDEAGRVMGNTFTMAVVISAVLTAALLIFMEPLLRIFGGGEETMLYARQYASIYCWGTPMVMLTLGMNGFITAQGFSKTSMLTVALGALINIVLDPIFIFKLEMGVSGAALATVISQTFSVVWVLVFLTGKRAIIKFRREAMRPVSALIRKISALGATGFCFAITNAMVVACSNVMLRDYGGDIYVGVMTVLSSVRNVMMVPVTGLTSGSQPVISYNYGAREYGRVRGCIRFVAVVGIVYSVIFWLLIMLFPNLFAGMFSDDAAFVALCVPNLRIYSCTFCIMSLMFSGQSTFVGLGKAKYAISFSLLRKVVLLIPLVLILPRFIGVAGVFWAEPISEVISAVASFTTMMIVVYRGLKEHPESV